MFQPKPSSVIQSIVQRALLKWWDEQRAGRIAPPRGEIDPHQLARYWNDIAVYEVVRGGDQPRFRFRFHGTGISLADGADKRGQFLDEVLPDSIQGHILRAYHTMLRLKCPLYTVRAAIDANKTPVRFERLLLPFSSRGDEIDDILAHIQTFCAAGRYERQHLFEASLTCREYELEAVLAPAQTSAGQGKG